MNLEEKAKREATGLPQNQKYIFIIGFESGYKECKSDLLEFIRVNPKSTTKQIENYLNEL